MAWTNKPMDLTGQKYGDLEVVAPAPRVNGKVAWLCRCKCGKELVVTRRSLREHKRTSCGCADNKLPLTYVDGTCIEMIQSKTVRKNNNSGVPGVFWSRKANKWRAQIGFKHQRIFLGYFSEFSDAVQARKDAEERYFAPLIEANERAKEEAAEGAEPL